MQIGIEHAHIGVGAGSKLACVEAEHACRRSGDTVERCGQRQFFFLRPLERQGQEQLDRGRAGLGFSERQLLGVVVHRRMVGADEIDGTVDEARAQRGAVARAAQRRHQMAVRVEPSDVDVAQMHVMDGDIASDRETCLLRRAHSRHAVVRRQPRQMHVHAGRAHELEDRVERDRFGEARNRR